VRVGAAAVSDTGGWSPAAADGKVIGVLCEFQDRYKPFLRKVLAGELPDSQAGLGIRAGYPDVEGSVYGEPS
jgi:hypothetical protein